MSAASIIIVLVEVPADSLNARLNVLVFTSLSVATKLPGILPLKVCGAMEPIEVVDVLLLLLVIRTVNCALDEEVRSVVKVATM